MNKTVKESWFMSIALNEANRRIVEQDEEIEMLRALTLDESTDDSLRRLVSEVRGLREENNRLRALTMGDDMPSVTLTPSEDCMTLSGEGEYMGRPFRVECQMVESNLGEFTSRIRIYFAQICVGEVYITGDTGEKISNESSAIAHALLWSACRFERRHRMRGEAA